MFCRKTNGVLKSDKREEAFEMIALQIVMASNNSIYVLEALNSIAQNPDKYPDPKLLVKEWLNHLFQYDFNLLNKEFRNEPKTIAKDDLNELNQKIFNYYLSLIPFYFDQVTIKSPDLEHKKYKWEISEFTELQKEILKYRYDDGNYDSNSENEKQCLKSIDVLKNSTRINRKFWNKSEKDWILNINPIKHHINQTKSNFTIYYKEEIFNQSCDLFMDNLSNAFDNFISDFYYKGTYLHKYFKWCN